MIHILPARRSYRRGVIMRGPFRTLLHLTVLLFVVFELSLRFAAPSCMTIGCLVQNISEFRIPILWTEPPIQTPDHPNIASNSATEPELDKMSGEKRAALARSRCREIYGDHSEHLVNPQYPFENRVFLLKEDNVAYCAIAKAFSTNIKRVMLHLTKPNPRRQKLKKDLTPINRIEYPHYLKYWQNSTVLKDYPPQNQMSVLSGYYKFLVVRDPVKKAISAYRDKFFSNTEDAFHKYFRRATGKYICRSIERYLDRVNAIKFLRRDSLDCGRDPAFVDLEAFLVWAFLIPSEYKPHQQDNLNPHWAFSVPICRICHPEVRYDFIGHFEEGMRDIDDIFLKLGWDFAFPNRSDTTISPEEDIQFREKVKSLPQELIAELDKAVAYERYILGYTNDRPT